MSERVTVDRIALKQVATWRVGNAGAIVCDCPPDCPDKNSSPDTLNGGHEDFYGGHFVCESVGGELAEFVVGAARLVERVAYHFENQPHPIGDAARALLAKGRT